MQAAIYARVSSQHQAKDQTIDQQIVRARQYVEDHQWDITEEHIYQDDGYSGANLSRPALDRLRDEVSLASIEVLVITAPDRLARKYLHQVLLLEELERHGVRVEFVERPMSDDPNDQLLLQIRGAVAEYERTLITERMRRGKLAKLRAGQLLPWTRGHYGYQVDPHCPRAPQGVRIDPYQASIVQQIINWYLAPEATLYTVSQQLEQNQIASPRGRRYWTRGSVRAVLEDRTYTGMAYANRYQMCSAKSRKSALLPIGPGKSYVERPREEWVGIPVPAIVSEEEYMLVQAKLAHNQQFAKRNLRHEFLLRGLVSCGQCHLTTEGRTATNGIRYYICRGRRDKLRRSEGRQCTARYVPVAQLDEIVWTDLCQVLSDPSQVAMALERIQAGVWVPEELQARLKTLEQTTASLQRQQERLLTAYMAEVIELAEFERTRREIEHKQETIQVQKRQIESIAQQRMELHQVASSIETFCEQVRTGLISATADQKRLLVELLIDHVIVNGENVEIRYVFPLSQQGAKEPFCHLRLDYVSGLPPTIAEIGNNV